MSPERAIVVWLPDWPVTAFRRARERAASAGDDDREAPVAIVRAGRVIACSAGARAEGVRRGHRRREAQAACPRLRVHPDDPDRDEREFHVVLAVLERHAPGAQALRPGLAALRARGPARFYRGEGQAGEALARALEEAGLPGARVGVADGVFTAEQAARSRTARPVCVVPAGDAADFLAPLGVDALGEPELALLLARLGVQTLGDLASLPAGLVHDRLGDRGVHLRSLAAGADSRRVVPRVPPPELERALDLEPPLELAEQVAFAVRRTADAFCAGLAEAGLVCTALRVTIDSDLGGRSERVWQHPTSFDAESVTDRVRWQLQPSPAEEALRGGVARVRLAPAGVDPAHAHQPALLGQGPDERAHHAMTRMQAVLGHTGVLSPALGGGRFAREREGRVPWGDGATPSARRDLPWPGALPEPLPAEVFRDPLPASVDGEGGEAVSVDARGLLVSAPARIDGRSVAQWAGPWPVVERGWDPRRARRAHRFQIVDDEGEAWLVVLEDDRWWREARYS
ncbi:DNA polymerase Y family protein [Microbacterium sp. gxy059]|uniref:DNA polymerase Y family protein n=1 Tax=Microbacterium sp. gxy059 TaxID=2957199 RepID=UPI003D98C8CD